MKAIRTTTAALAAALVLAGLTVSPAAADEIPTAVQVSWADGQVRVTWQESAPQPNVVEVHSTFGVSFSQQVAADAPNEVLIPVGTFGRHEVARVAVNAGTEPGEPRAYSPDFDTNAPPTPVVTAATGGYGDSATVSWRAGDVPIDTTPGDPLDLPQEQELYQLGWRYPGEAGWSPIGELSSATTATGRPSLPERRSYDLVVLTSANEWGPADPEQARAITRVRATAATAAWVDRRTLGGSVGVYSCFFECSVNPQADRRVVLEHRLGAGHPWRQVASTTSSADGGYQFTSLRPAGEHRVNVPPRAAVAIIHEVDLGTITPVPPR